MKVRLESEESRFIGAFSLIQGKPENLPAFSNVPLREL